MADEAGPPAMVPGGTDPAPASRRKGRVWLLPSLMAAGAAVGGVIGVGCADCWLAPASPAEATLSQILVPGLMRLLGDIFMNLLKMLVVPLIVFSVVHAVAGLGDLRKAGRLVVHTLFYFLLTMLLAVLLGMLLVNTIQPGVDASTQAVDAASQARVEKLQTDGRSASSIQAVFDLVRGIFPSNLFQAAAQMQVLGLIMFSLFFGAILGTLGHPGQKLAEQIGTLNEALMTFIRLVIWLAPLGILGLIADRLGSSGGSAVLGGELRRLGWYAFTVVAGLLLHGVVTLPLLLYFLGRKNPFRYAVGMGEALLTAFTTASSAATLPVSMRCMVERNGVHPRTVGFVLPLGATVNMNGTALYEAVAAIFIAQAYGVPLDTGQQVLVVITATLAAVGAAAIPEAGLVTMTIVLVAVGLPVSGIALILSIDWILDRCRTTVNVWDDAVATGIVDRWHAKGR